MPIWLPGLAIALLVGFLASAYLWLVRRHDDEVQAGLHALSSMRWRDFSRLVLQAMAARGLNVTAPDLDESREPKASFLLSQGTQRWLLSCKHGSAYRIGSASVEELASSVRLSGANGGILATDGHVQKSGRETAEDRRIELLDGHRLWGEIKPLLDTHHQKQIMAEPQARAKRHIAIAWLASVTLGAIVMFGLNQARTPASPTPAASINQPVAPASRIQAKPAAAEPPTSTYREPSELELEQQRAKVMKAVGGIPGVARASWLTRLTLSVDLEAAEKSVWPRICQQLELYPALSTARVQLNPPPESQEPVRWRQCQTM